MFRRWDERFANESSWEMKKNLVPLVGIALAVALVATGVFYYLLSSRMQPAAAKANAGSPVVVATRAIAAGAKITRDDVKSVMIQGAAPDALISLEQAVDKVALSAIGAGDPLSNAKVASASGGGGVGVSMGMRAISIQVADSSGILASVKPGHRVDVQAIQVRDTHDVEIRTVAEDIEVMKIGPPDPSSGKSGFPVVTMLVTPDEANVIALADTSTRVRLSLRNPLDRGRVTAPPLHVTTMMRGSRWASQPAAAPASAAKK